MERYTSPRPGKIHRKRSFPSEVGWQKDLYKSPEADGSEAQRLEMRFFGVVDSRAAKALVKLNEPNLQAVPNPEATHWAMFMFSLLHRSPAYLAGMKTGGERILRRMLPRLLDKYGGRSEELQSYISEFDANEAERRVLSVLPGVMANTRILEALNGLNWMVVDVPPDCPELLLSDDPLARTNGLKIEHGHLAMPLSPRRLLVGAWESAFADQLRRMRSKDLVKGMNRWCVESARHFVAATDRRQEPFICKWFGKDPKPGLLESVEAAAGNSPQTGSTEPPA